MTTIDVPGFEGTLGKENKYSDNFFVWTYDFNKDRWNDILVIGFPGQDTSWFENPKGKDGHWTRHKIFDQTDNESPTFTDLTGDGRPELVCITKGQYGYADTRLERSGEAVDVPRHLAEQQVRQLHARAGRR